MVYLQGLSILISEITLPEKVKGEYQYYISYENLTKVLNISVEVLKW